MLQRQELIQEWQLLQQEFDSYEKYSLLIKLVAVVLFIYCFSNDVRLWLVLFGLFVLWGQDAIWKTFQSRIEIRLLSLEAALAAIVNEQNESTNSSANEPSDVIIAFQFNLEFAAQRGGIVNLIKEYTAQALRPTVLFPHALLCGAGIISFI